MRVRDIFPAFAALVFASAGARGAETAARKPPAALQDVRLRLPQKTFRRWRGCRVSLLPSRATR